MSELLDKKIVEMQFNNKQFEDGIKTSLSSLDRLKQSLKFEGVQKGFESITEAAKSCSFSGIQKGIETVHAKFSAFEVMAVTALANITNSAINAGKNLVKALAIDPINQGFEEYELKMGSIQTIMASTGETLETVNKYLNDLNTYADKTIYSFSDMTSNIGKFTNAGVKLEDAVKAIQGISNEAAVSGANANEASRAMYNFAQALSAGYVKLIDWKSIENANMATVEFKQQLIDTAVAMGTVVKVGDDYQSTTTDLKGQVSELFNSTSMFNDSLSSQWMTTDVLVQTLGNYSTDIREMSEEEKKAYENKLKLVGYTDEQIEKIEELGKKAFDSAQDVKTFTQLMDTLKEAAGSGWAMTWEIIFGNFEEAKKLWTDVNKVVGDMINSQSEARNQLLQTWKDLGGRNDVIEAIRNIWKALTDIAKPIKEAFRDIFPATTAVQLKTITNNIRNFTEHLKISDETAEKIKTTFKGVFGIFDILKKTFLAVAKAFSPIADRFGELSGGLLDMASQFGSFLIGLNESADKMGVFEEITKRLSSAIKILSEFIFDFSNNTIVSFIEGGEGISGVFEVIFDTVANVTKAIFDVISALSGKDLSGARDKVVKVIQTIRNSIVDAVTNFKEFAEKVKEYLNIPDFDTIKEKVSGFITLIKENFKVPGFELLHNILERIHERMSQLGEFFGKFKSSATSAIQAIADVIIGSNLFETIEKIWKIVKTVVTGTVKGIGTLIKAVSSGLGDMDFSKTFDIFNSISFGAIAAGIVTFVKGFKDTVKDISSIKESFVGVLDGVKDCLSAFTIEIKADALMRIASALAILAGSILVISLINSDKLEGSLEALTVMFIDIVAALTVVDKLVKDERGVKKAATAMISMSAAVLVLAAALKKMSEIESGKLLGSLGAITVLIGEIIIVSRTMKSDSGGMIKSAAAMVIFGAAVNVLASACMKFTDLETERIVKGLVSVEVLLAELSLFMNTTKFNKSAVSSGIGIVLIAEAIKVLASSCSVFAGQSVEQIVKGLAGVGALLIEVALFTKLTGNAKHIISTGVSLIAIAAAMKIFASVMEDFSNFSWEEIGKGLVTLGGALAEVAIAVRIMPKNMISIGTGLVLVGAAFEIIANVLGKFSGFSWEEIGKGLVTLGGALAELAIALNVMKGAIGGAAALAVASASLLLITPVLSILGAMSWESIAKGLVALAGAFTIIGVAGALLSPVMPSILGLGAALALIGVGVLALGTGLVAAGAGLSAIGVGVTALSASLTAVAAAIVAAIGVIIIGILDMVPQIISSIGDIIIATCEAIANMAPALGEAIKAVVLMVVDVIIECAPQIAEGLMTLIDGALAALANHIGPICDSLFKIVIEILNSISEHAPEFIQAVVGVFQSIFDGVATLFDGGGSTDLLESIAKIGNALGSIFGSFIGGIAGGIMDGIIDQFPEMGQNLADFMTNAQPFFDGLKKIDSKMLDGIGALSKIILSLTAAELIDGLTSWFTGNNSMAKFGEELAEFGPYLVKYAESIKGIDSEAVRKSADAGKALAEMAKAFPNDGGVAGWFMGENNASTFGENIASFGPKLMEYAKSVKGIDSKSVIDSTEAGKALAEMAKAFPNDGGVAGWFMGENNTVDFGKNIAKFGLYLSDYGRNVRGLSATAIISSVPPATALIEMAEKFPNNGGVMGWFMGENNAATFGENIADFGLYLKKYANNVKDIKFPVILKSVELLDGFIDAAERLGDSKIDDSLKEFGNGLSSFGKKFGSYYSDISDINTQKFSLILIEVEKVVDIANGMSKVDSKKFGKFGENLKKIGKNGIDEFIKAFSDAENRIKESAEKVVVIFINAAKAKEESEKLYYNLAVGFISSFCDGVYDSFEDISLSAKAVTDAAIDAINGISDDFYKAGKYAAIGFENGINAYTDSVYNAGKKIGRSALSGIEEVLLINSPSYAAYMNGAYFSEGLAGGIEDNSTQVIDKSKSLGKKMLEGLKTSLSGTIGKNSDILETFLGEGEDGYVITPVIDTSELEKGAKEIDKIIGTDRSYNAAQETEWVYDGPTYGYQSRYSDTEYVNDDPELLHEVKLLRNDVNTLYDKIEKIKVVLDSGALVGGIQNQMDSALGTREQLVSMGVYKE